ncbi:MAG TPA: peptidylprolyl isomerase [Rhodanobacteraceae bacterium]|nr:peptidylprolyl isomerase [Rhodanobacteraceae bacterium]
MKVENNKVVAFHYTVSENGEAVESSRERGEPLAFLVGHGGLIPGLEAALMGREAGEKFDVSVPPEQAYGERRADFTQRVPKKYFRDPDHLRPGMLTVLSTREGGQRQVEVLKVGSSVVDVDLNHPLAGKTLAFDVEIVDVRDATPEEISHGHAHGVSGHGHQH